MNHGWWQRFPAAVLARTRCLGSAGVLAPTFLAAQGPPPGPAVPATAPSAVTAFVDVTVVPMDRERLLPHQTVVVQGDRITALGPTRHVRVPTGATRIDGRGKYLIPGLGDMHVHFATKLDAIEQWLYANAANGVTTVRIMSADVPLAYRDQVAKGELIGPRLYVAAGPLDNAAQVVAAKDSGYDLVKLYGINGLALDTLAATAHRLRIPIAGHAPWDEHSPLGLQRAIEVGYASIEHLTGFDFYLGNAQWWSYWLDATRTAEQGYQMLADSAKLRAIATALARAKVWNCPTLAMYDATLLPPADTWPELRYLTPNTQAGIRSSEKRKDISDTAPAARQWVARRPAMQAAVEVRRAIVRALHAAGAGLLLGTDTPVPYMVPGFAVHRELEAFVRAGLRPYDALATGTRNVAAYFGTLDSSGTVAVGKRADLVLLHGNPLADIRHTRTPAGVMLGGRWLDRTALDRGLAAIEGTLAIMR